MASIQQLIADHSAHATEGWMEPACHNVRQYESHLASNEGIDEVAWGLRERQKEVAPPGGILDPPHQPHNLLVQLHTVAKPV